MEHFRRYHSLRHTTTNSRHTRYRVTNSTSFGYPPFPDSASHTPGRRSSPDNARDYYNPPASASTNRTPDPQPRHSDRDTVRIHRYHSVSVSTRDTPDRQPSVQQATSKPAIPLEAVKLFLVVMCEETERYYDDEFQIRRAAKHLAQDLKYNFGVRLPAEELLRKYRILKEIEEDMIRYSRPGPEEHELIMILHRRRVRQLEEERKWEEEREREEEERERETEMAN